MICNNCGNICDKRTVGFQNLCENCGEYLHTCFNCNIYDSTAERCRSFTTEAVGDRKGKNYCEEFIPNKGIVPGPDSVRGNTSDDFETLFNMNGEKKL